MEPSTILLNNLASVIAILQDKLIQQLKNANAKVKKSSWTINVSVLQMNLFGMVKLVLPVHQEQHMSQKIDNVTIVQKDLLLIQSPINANQHFEVEFDFCLMYFHDLVY